MWMTSCFIHQDQEMLVSVTSVWFPNIKHCYCVGPKITVLWTSSVLSILPTLFSFSDHVWNSVVTLWNHSKTVQWEHLHTAYCIGHLAATDSCRIVSSWCWMLVCLSFFCVSAFLSFLLSFSYLVFFFLPTFVLFWAHNQQTALPSVFSYINWFLTPSLGNPVHYS